MIRWHFGSDASVFYPGWYIDDVVGVNFAWTGITEENTNTITRTALYAPKPNPVANGMAHISFMIATPSKTSLKVYNASGRLIKTLVNEKLTNGTYNYIWNGTDNNSREVADGIYFYINKN
jgi:flagellar hook assembly protein FlgD